VQSEVVELRTGSQPKVVDLGDVIDAFCQDKGEGLLNVFVPHATAGLAVIEVGSGSDEDLLAIVDRLLPRSGDWRHRHGTSGHGADHVLPAFLSPSLTVPVINGRPALGTWQSIVLVDTNRDNATREIRLSFLAG
jgi:secondary thiamine-phosphate synthase enzyme